MNSTARADRGAAEQWWRGQASGVRALLKSRRAQDFSRHLCFTLAVYATGVVVEKLLVVPYLARHLSEAAFGALLLGRNSTVIISGGLASGIYNLLLRQNRDWEEVAKAVAVRSAVALSVLLSLVIATLALATLAARQGPDFLRQQALPIFALTVWGVANTATFILQTYWRMQFRIAFFSSLQLLTGVALALVIPGHLWLGLPGVYWGFVGAGLGPLLITLALGYREMAGQGAPLWRAADAWEIGRRMWVFVWGAASQSLLQNTDRFIIGYLIGAAAVGAYFKATNVAYMVVVLAEPVAGLLLTMAAQQRVGPQTVRHLRLLHLLILAALTSALVIGIILGRPLTDVLYGAGTFASGKHLYAILLAGCSLSVASVLLRGMLVVHVPMRWIVGIDAFSVLFTASGSWLLVSSYGLTGAAVAAALSMLFRAVMSEAAVRLSVRRHLQAGSGGARRSDPGGPP